MPVGHIFGPSGASGTRAGLAVFCDERGSTTIAAAVAILVSLALVFGMANVQWVTARSADVQAVADAGALAGMNVVAGYVTVVQVIDAAVLSLGLVGMLVLAIGLVLSAIPFVNVAGPPVMEAGLTVLETRASFAQSAARGLKKVEEAVPYVVAANSLLAIRANAGANGSYVGVAVPYPLEGASDFGLLSYDDAAKKAAEAKEQGDEVDAHATVLGEAQQKANDALARGWAADCGNDPSMRERASALAGLQGQLNPNYPTSTGWDFGVPILRARAYYQQRLVLEAPVDASPAEATRSAARKAFYEYALAQVNASSYVRNDDGTVTCDLRGLPANTEDVRATTLYTDAVWPCTSEAAGRTIHAYPACPGATGSFAGTASVADEEAGLCLECSVCMFTVVDLGRVPAASTSIENGFEHHWKLVVEASRDYESACAELAVQEQVAKEASAKASDLFLQALEDLVAVRVEFAPPGRYGCVCVVADPYTHVAPQSLVVLAGSGATLPPRVAVSAAALAPDRTVTGNNVLAGFFDGLVAQGGFVGGASSVLDSVMSAWGDLLVSYGGGYNAFMGSMDVAFTTLGDLGLGNVSSWLKAALKSAVELAAVEPADLTPKKPVLVNSADVMSRAGNDWYVQIRAFAMAVQALSPDAGVQGVLEALGVYVETLTGTNIVVLELPIPGTERTHPLELDLGTLGEAA